MVERILSGEDIRYYEDQDDPAEESHVTDTRPSHGLSLPRAGRWATAAMRESDVRPETVASLCQACGTTWPGQAIYPQGGGTALDYGGIPAGRGSPSIRARSAGSSTIPTPT